MSSNANTLGYRVHDFFFLRKHFAGKSRARGERGSGFSRKRRRRPGMTLGRVGQGSNWCNSRRGNSQEMLLPLPFLPYTRRTPAAAAAARFAAKHPPSRHVSLNDVVYGDSIYILQDVFRVPGYRKQEENRSRSLPTLAERWWGWARWAGVKGYLCTESCHFYPVLAY